MTNLPLNFAITSVVCEAGSEDLALSASSPSVWVNGPDLSYDSGEFIIQHSQKGMPVSPFTDAPCLVNFEFNPNGISFKPKLLGVINGIPNEYWLRIGERHTSHRNVHMLPHATLRAIWFEEDLVVPLESLPEWFIIAVMIEHGSAERPTDLKREGICEAIRILDNHTEVINNNGKRRARKGIFKEAANLLREQVTL